MAENEYKELVEFVGKQFERLYDKLDQTNKNLGNRIGKVEAEIGEVKADIEDRIEEIKRHVDIRFEEVQHKFELTAEGIAAINEKLDRFHEENEREHRRLEKATLVNTADISSLDQRVGRLEGKV